MKKFLVLALIVALCMALCACGDDNKLVGSWKLSKGNDVLTFNKDGTVEEDGEKKKKWETDDKDTLILTKESGKKEYYTYQVTDKILKIKKADDPWGWKDEIYERVD